MLSANKEFIQMTLQDMLDAIRRSPDFDKAGMVACHIGVVRATSKDGRTVKGLEIEVDRNRLETILLEMKGCEGIIEVAVHLFEGYRKVSEDVMFVAVAGDIREHVFPVLEDTVNRIKQEVTRKKEFFAQ
jgi:molybdopterin synthase catalytic subunit